MAKVWRREALTDEALIESIGLVRDLATYDSLPFWLVERARRIEKILPPLIDSKEPTV